MATSSIFCSQNRVSDLQNSKPLFMEKVSAEIGKTSTPKIMSRYEKSCHSLRNRVTISFKYLKDLSE